jgi:hypothetical protein
MFSLGACGFLPAVPLECRRTMIGMLFWILADGFLWFWSCGVDIAADWW